MDGIGLGWIDVEGGIWFIAVAGVCGRWWGVDRGRRARWGGIGKYSERGIEMCGFSSGNK